MGIVRRVPDVQSAPQVPPQQYSLTPIASCSAVNFPPDRRQSAHCQPKTALLRNCWAFPCALCRIGNKGAVSPVVRPRHSLRSPSADQRYFGKRLLKDCCSEKSNPTPAIGRKRPEAADDIRNDDKLCQLHGGCIRCGARFLIGGDRSCCAACRQNPLDHLASETARIGAWLFGLQGVRCFQRSSGLLVVWVGWVFSRMGFVGADRIGAGHVAQGMHLLAEARAAAAHQEMKLERKAF